MSPIKDFFSKESTKRILFFIALIIFFYWSRSFFDIFLLTFLFSYIMNSLQNLLLRKVHKVTSAKEKLTTSILYILLFLSIGIIIVKIVPQIVSQTKYIINNISSSISNTKTNPKSNTIESYIINILSEIDIKSYLKSGVNMSLQLAANIGKWSLNTFISIILSLFFMLEKHKIISFVQKFKYSKVSGLYEYLCFFGENFLNTFGKVIQAQILIAFINTIISVIMLYILNFPQLVTIGFMIFMLSLIPIAGVLISLIPLCIIAFSIGGITKVIYVLIMIAIVHAIESYILNPKLMSSKVQLPIFFTFIVLIVSQHLMGIWGLLIGIPLFIFILNLLGVKTDE